MFFNVIPTTINVKDREVRQHMMAWISGGSTHPSYAEGSIILFLTLKVFYFTQTLSQNLIFLSKLHLFLSPYFVGSINSLFFFLISQLSHCGLCTFIVVRNRIIRSMSKRIDELETLTRTNETFINLVLEVCILDLIP
jgi:hypothetical protein